MRIKNTISFLLLFVFFLWISFRKPSHTVKTILFYHKAWGRADWGFGLGSQPFIKCPQHNCWVTDKRDIIPIENFDAVLMMGEPQDGPNQTKRRAHQRYVYFTRESPAYVRANSSINYFNWTMTYRRDADIQVVHGWILELDSPDTRVLPPYVRWLSKHPTSAKISQRLAALPKPRPVAWMVSKCRAVSKRMDYVRELQKYIPVDIYGKCGNKTCDKRNSKDCSKILETEYKFYLSFENSLCRNYVTEKFYRQLGLDIVPVVRGSANYSLLAPPGSYINTANFASPRDLALELVRLGGNQEEYTQHFWWKDHYRVRPAGMNAAMCNLCNALHEDRPSRSYINLSSWWRDGACEERNEWQTSVTGS